MGRFLATARRIRKDLTPYLLDTFADANSTSIASHTPTTKPSSSSWSQTNASSFYIQNNKLVANRYTDGDLAVIDCGQSDFSYTGIVLPFNSSNNQGFPGLVFRYVDASNFYYVFPNVNLGYVQVWKVAAGVSTSLITYPYTLQSLQDVEIRIDCKGPNITLYINGIEIVTYCDNFNKTATKVGVRLGKSNSPATSPQWAGLKVEPFKGINLNWPVVTEYSGNPIVALGAGGSWESNDINDPNVVWNPTTNQFDVFYSGYNGNVNNDQQVGIASSNGDTILGSWTKYSGNPVFSGGGHNGQNGGFVYKNGTLYNYYGSNSAGKISCATSTDGGRTWTDHGVVIDVGGAGAWDVNGVFDAFARLRQDGVTIEVWYAAKDSGSNRRAGFATSTNGLTFTKSPGNPYFGPQGWAGSTTTFGEPSIYVPPGKEGLEYLASFDSALVGSTGDRFISQAISVDGGRTWHYRIQALGPSGSGWESVQVFDSFMLVYNGNFYLFHGGANTAGAALNLNIEIGVASCAYPYTSLLGAS